MQLVTYLLGSSVLYLIQLKAVLSSGTAAQQNDTAITINLQIFPKHN